jgi:hypothetical protein
MARVMTNWSTNKLHSGDRRQDKGDEGQLEYFCLARNHLPRVDEYGSFDRPAEPAPQEPQGSAKENPTRKAYSLHEGNYLRRHQDTTVGDTTNIGSPSSPSPGETTEDVPSLTAAFRSVENRPILLNCLLYLTIYYFVAVIAYSYGFERWSIIDSLYFATNTL